VPRGPSDLDDAIQQLLVGLWEHAPEALSACQAETVGQLRGYLVGCIRNALLSMAAQVRKRERREAGTLLDEGDRADPQTSEGAEAALLEELRHHIGREAGNLVAVLDLHAGIPGTAVRPCGVRQTQRRLEQLLHLCEDWAGLAHTPRPHFRKKS
jgi:hypothetical protein